MLGKKADYKEEGLHERRACMKERNRENASAVTKSLTWEEAES